MCVQRELIKLSFTNNIDYNVPEYLCITDVLRVISGGWYVISGLCGFMFGLFQARLDCLFYLITGVFVYSR